MPDLTNMMPFDTAGADKRALATVQGMVTTVLTTVRLARSLAQSNREIDLSGLDRDVGLLCARALDLPQPVGRRLRPSLNTLRRELESLSLALAPAKGEQS